MFGLTYDSPIMQKLSFLGDLMQLNLCLLLGCIPIITAGASITAAYAVLFRLNNKSSLPVFRTFWKYFRSEFRQSTIVWIVTLLICGALSYNGLILLSYGDGISIIWWVLFALVSIMLIFSCSYLFPQIAQYHNNVLGFFKNAIRLGIINPLRSLLLVLLHSLPFFLFLVDPTILLLASILWLLLGFSLSLWIASLIISRTFAKIENPETDSLPMELY